MSMMVQAVEPGRCVAMAGNRVVNTKSPKFVDLVASIKAAGGNYEAGIGRPHPALPNKIELASGHRRALACEQAGVMFNVSVSDFSDTEMVDIRVLANRGREDLTVLEEGRDVADMIRVHGSIKAAADKMRVSEKWVARRAQLAKLIPAWVTLCESESVIIGIGQAELVASLPVESQKALFELFRANTAQLAPDRLVSFKESVARSGIAQVLSAAPWKLDDEALCPKAGACSGCAKRSAAAPLLFDPDSFGEFQTKGKKALEDRCLDGACWKAKLEAFSQARVRAALAKHPNAVRLANFERWNVTAAELKQFEADGVVGCWDAPQTKKSAPDAVAGVIVAGADVGEVVWVVDPKRKSSGRDGQDGRDGESDEDEGQVAPSPVRGDTDDDKRAKIERRRWLVVAQKVRETVEVCECPDSCNPDKFADEDAGGWMGNLLELVAAFGTAHSGLSQLADPKAHGLAALSVMGCVEQFGKFEDVKLARLVFGQVRPLIVKQLQVSGAALVNEAFIEGVRASAGLVGLDCDALKAVADEEIPLPKALQGNS